MPVMVDPVSSICTASRISSPGLAVHRYKSVPMHNINGNCICTMAIKLTFCACKLALTDE